MKSAVLGRHHLVVEEFHICVLVIVLVLDQASPGFDVDLLLHVAMVSGMIGWIE